MPTLFRSFAYTTPHFHNMLYGLSIPILRMKELRLTWRENNQRSCIWDRNGPDWTQRPCLLTDTTYNLKTVALREQGYFLPGSKALPKKELVPRAREAVLTFLDGVWSLKATWQDSTHLSSHSGTSSWFHPYSYHEWYMFDEELWDGRLYLYSCQFLLGDPVIALYKVLKLGVSVKASVL